MKKYRDLYEVEKQRYEEAQEEISRRLYGRSGDNKPTQKAQ